MKRKKIALCVCTLSTVVISSMVLFFGNNVDAVRGEKHGSSCAWNHYDAVEAKTAKHGSKEFWACCTHDGYVLERPESGTITDCGSFSGTYFDSLDFSDDRYIPEIGSTPLKNGNEITYGIYPQTNVNDPSLIASLNSLETPESNGFFIYEGEYYAKCVGQPYYEDSMFDNGTVISSETTYWFSCEPIEWTILDNDGQDYYVLSSFILDAHCFYNDSEFSRTVGGSAIYPNDYEHSDMRDWLNSDFFNTAFSLNNTFVQTTNVDNSASTTDSLDNEYAGNNTSDNVFLPSYKDYHNTAYGFVDSDDPTSTRSCKTTDWCRARGACYSQDSLYLYNGYYYTRSPSSIDGDCTWLIEHDGFLCDYYNNYYSDFSVRPAVSLRF